MNGFEYIRRSILQVTMEELANKMGVGKSLISMWEKEKQIIPHKRRVQLEELTGIPAWAFSMKDIGDAEKQVINRYAEASGYAIKEKSEEIARNPTFFLEKPYKKVVFRAYSAFELVES